MQYQTTCKTPASSHMDHLDRVVLVSTQKKNRVDTVLYKSKPGNGPASEESYADNSDVYVSSEASPRQPAKMQSSDYPSTAYHGLFVK